MVAICPVPNVTDMTGTALRIVVAAPLEGARRTLRRLLEERCGWDVVAEAGDGLSAVSRARVHHADVLLVDGAIEGPDLAGVRALLASSSSVLVVGLVEQPAELAASGIAVLKSAPAERIRETVLGAVHARTASA